ncbi:MAG: restriction endonuclease subunit S, partial [Akkermansia muciniphila]|nr:restriction endonuclease subunit S [Akkermansia muciniphila]
RGGCTLPEVRFAGFDEEWEKRKLGAIGKTYSGLSGKTKDDIGHGEGFFVTYMNVYSNPIATESMTERVELDSSQTEVSYGDVFFTISSETPEEVAMASVWLFETSDTYLNSFCFGFRPQQDLLDPYFFAYELRAPLFRGAVTFLAQGISRYNISKNRVMDIYVFFPGKSEQTAIGRLFRKLDDLITLHGQKLEKLRHVKQALLGKMFV